MFNVFSSDCIGNAANCSYPHRFEITDKDSLQTAVQHDFVCAEYKNNRRSKDGFLRADCLPVDCDNDHSDDPSSWVNPEDVANAFPGVCFAVHYSRNHMKEKSGRAKRPRFHILFPVEPITDAETYCELKRKVNTFFPFFDSNAMDAARFFFGTPDPAVELYDGPMTLTAFLKEDELIPDLPDDFSAEAIPEGTRNSSLSRFAARVLKRYGDNDEAYQAFIEKAAKCEPPLDDEELSSIWRSAQKFYDKIRQQPGYIDPDQYNSCNGYKPSDYSDVGQAAILAKEFSSKLRYSPATGFLRYNGSFWQETETGAQAVAHELTDRQLIEASLAVEHASSRLSAYGIQNIPDSSMAKASTLMGAAQQEAYKDLKDAKAYQKHVLLCRNSKNITAVLKEVRPMLEISPGDLDADPFLLCTPEATYDLREGLSGAREHRSEDFLTKMTAVSPGTKGEALWLDCLNLIFCNDAELIEYVQIVCGLAAIGAIRLEALIIAYGNGRNGKSTFWNTISRVLGMYSGNISADTLTVNCYRNVKPELAEAKGKRLLIAAEMQEGARLNDSTVKQLCSTDDLFAEKKYKDPFSFTPTHTLVLYTNHLPRVSATDDGIWRRLIVIPFNAKIDAKSDISNYAEHLFQEAGEAVLAWVIEGARKVISMNYKFAAPQCVQDAIAEYRDQNNWFGHFLEDQCEIGSDYRESSSALYQAYRLYCSCTNEYIRSTADFYSALTNAGFSRVTCKNRRYFKGLKLKAEAL